MTIGLLNWIGLSGSRTPAPTYSGSFTLTAIAAYQSKRIYQRATTTGGEK